MPTPSYLPSLPVRWNQLILGHIAATGTPPPMAARILGIAHTAMYDAWTAYTPRALGARLSEYLRRPAEEHILANAERAISYAAYTTLRTYFPENILKDDKKAELEEMMHHLGYDPADTSTNPESATGIGILAARTALDHHYGDGANTWQNIAAGKPYADYTNYRPTVGPDDVPAGAQLQEWQPLKIKKDGKEKVQEFLVPHWGLVEPFALSYGGQLRPLTIPKPCNSDAFRQQCQQLLDISANLTDREKCIAEFWAAGPGTVTPPGMWHQLAHEVSKRGRYELDDDIRLYFALGNAAMDASIACWECKRFYNYVRPVTAIRHLYKGKKVWAWGGPFQGREEVWGQAWQPYQPLDFVTPPFPEYPSGHSTFSAAAADILRRFTGTDAFDHRVELDVGSSQIEPGETPAYVVTLHWHTFTQAAEEAGMSRLYGGIHFMDGNEQGQLLGRKVADRVWRRCTRLWEGQR